MSEKLKKADKRCSRCGFKSEKSTPPDYLCHGCQRAGENLFSIEADFGDNKWVQLDSTHFKDTPAAFLCEDKARKHMEKFLDYAPYARAYLMRWFSVPPFMDDLPGDLKVDQL
jgi:hypothetical protein